MRDLGLPRHRRAARDRPQEAPAHLGELALASVWTALRGLYAHGWPRSASAGGPEAPDSAAGGRPTTARAIAASGAAIAPAGLLTRRHYRGLPIDLTRTRWVPEQNFTSRETSPRLHRTFAGGRVSGRRPRQRRPVARLALLAWREGVDLVAMANHGVNDCP